MENKKEYAAKNLAWLEEKSKEEGVKALVKGIYYKVIKSAEKTISIPLHATLSPHIIRVTPSMERNSTAVEAVLHWQCA